MAGAEPAAFRTETRVAADEGTVPAAGAAVAVAAVATAVAAAYATELSEMRRVWDSEPNYSHGYLVIPVALAILWQRREGWAADLRPWRWGWLLLAAALAARGVFAYRGNGWAERMTLLPVLAALSLTLGGGPLFARVWTAVAYLVFMIPLPPRLESLMAQPLQRLATSASCSLLGATGLWVMAEGNVIHVGPHQLEVARACNGLSMLACLAATVTAAVLLVPARPWKKLVLVASTVPVALVSNVLRITATAWCYQRYGAEVGERFAHDAAGWLMMPLALALVGAELLLLNLLFFDEEAVDVPMILGRPIVGRPAALPGAPAPPPAAPDAGGDTPGETADG